MVFTSFETAASAIFQSLNAYASPGVQEREVEACTFSLVEWFCLARSGSGKEIATPGCRASG